MQIRKPYTKAERDAAFRRNIYPGINTPIPPPVENESKAGNFLNDLFNSSPGRIRGLEPVDIPKASEVMPFDPNYFVGPVQPQTPVGNLPEGITPVGGTPVVNSQNNEKKVIQDLIGDVRNPMSGISNVETPNLKVSGITPDVLLNAVSPTGQVRGGGKESIPGAESESKAGSFLSDPRFGYIAGKIGAALVPEGYAQKDLGELGAQMSLNRVYDTYREQLKAGKEPAGGQFNLLTPEMKTAARQEILGEKKTEANIRTSEAYAKQAEASAKGIAPWETKFAHELELAGLKQKDNLKNTWMSVGQGHVYNWVTGETKSLYGWQKGEGGDNKTQQRMWYNTARQDSLEALERAGFGKIIKDAQGNPSFKWDNPKEAESTYKQYLEDTISLYQEDDLLPKGFMGISPPKIGSVKKVGAIEVEYIGHGKWKEVIK